MKRSDPTGRTAGDVQFKLLLPRGLQQRLAASAEERGVSVSEEIRRRLDASFVVEADQHTIQFTEAIKLAAPPGWHSSPRAFAIFRAAIDVLLRQFQPRGELPPEAALTGLAQEGAMMAGVALGALKLSFRVGENPTRREGSKP